MKGIRRKKGEKWLPIAGFDSYMISSCGRVYSIKRKKALKPFCANKYLYVKLFNNGKPKNFRIHRLVAQAFIGNEDNKPIVHHKDRNTKNNKAENLMWVTSAEHLQIHKTKKAKGATNE